MSLHLPKRLWSEVEAHASRAYPEECCGALIGPLPQGFERPGREVVVTELAAFDNAWEAAGRCNRYQVDPVQMGRLERRLLGTGTGIVGYYHSHPDVPDWPSPFDLMLAWPCCSYLIVSVVGAKARSARSWMRSEDGREFLNEPFSIS